MSRNSKIVLAIVAVVALAVVGGYVGAGFRGSSNSATSSTVSTVGDFMKGIKDRGELRVGVALSPPLTAEQPDGTLGGPNIIPLQQLAAELGVKFVPVKAEWANIVAGLQAGRYDFAANLDYSVERSLAIQFTDPVYEYQGVFVVKASSPYTTAQQIMADGGKIATAQGTAPEAVLKDAGGVVMPINSYANAVSAIHAGRAIAEFVDLPTAVGQAQAESSLKIVVPKPTMYAASAGYGVPEDTDPRSLQTVNIAIERARSSGILTHAYAKVGYLEINNLGDLEKK